MLKVQLLGSFEVSFDARQIQISRRSAQSLFAYLVINSGTQHRREQLARMLWPDSPETTARENLRHALWRIRKTLPSNPKTEYLFSDDLSIAFNGSCEFWLDVDVLRSGDKLKYADALIDALSIYQGMLLPGFDDEWVRLEREYLNFVFEHNMARLLSILQNENRWLDVLDWAERWIASGQRPEPAYRALMLANMEKGDMPRVADAYARCVGSLNEIGLEPSELTRELFEKIKAENLQSNQ